MTRKKLIEVALPLEAINAASAREKSIRHGHPSTLHLWWARRPLASARAVIFASLVDDPDQPEAPAALVEACNKLPKGANATLNDTPRMRLFDFIEKLVTWEATTDEKILQTARDLIRLATDGNPPPLLDPFAGGGSIPLEAQRLGLEAHASDLNPVAVMINKAQIEIPPRFAEQLPVNPTDRNKLFAKQDGKRTPKHRKTKLSDAPDDSADSPAAVWRGAAGLAADVRYYGAWMREQAFEKIGHLYPKHNGETVIAWIWARTVKSPNPAVNVQVPLVRSFILSKKKGRGAWIEPHYDPALGRVVFTVKREQDGDKPSTVQDGTVNRRGGRCLVTGEPIPFEYIRAEGRAGRIGAQLMAVVTEGNRARNYHTAILEHQNIANSVNGGYKPAFDISHWPGRTNVVEYGMTQFADLFTPRQLVALTTFSDLVAEARTQAQSDALAAGLPDDDIPLREGGRGARAYAEAVSVYLAFVVDRLSMRSSSLSGWDNSADLIRTVFSRQAIPMVWDYAEANPFSGSTGNFAESIEWVAEATESIEFSDKIEINCNNSASQIDAGVAVSARNAQVISTDPPYYDNIGYADLSDFFYVWMRPMLRGVYPDLFGTVMVPKEPELIASPYRHGGREAANRHFEDGMKGAFRHMLGAMGHDVPLTVYYAFKQSEADEADDDAPDDDDEATPSRRVQVASTGWETMLTGLIEAGFSINGTWPMRTEMGNRMIGSGANALASSIVLVCRPRPSNAPTASRRQFVEALRRELPAALGDLQTGNIAPVDLAQASIGPGMAVYSRYGKILEADGTPLTVRDALYLINQELDAYLEEQDGALDAETRFAVAWFKQFKFADGAFGDADTLARAKNTSVNGVEQAGLVMSGSGKVRLIYHGSYDPSQSWDPALDKRPTVWEATHYLISRLEHGGEGGAAKLLNGLPPEMGDAARALAYRLYNICERKGWADHARDYNGLVVQWSAISDEAARLRASDAGEQLGLL